MPTRYDLVLEWTGEPLDPQERKRAIARRRLRIKEAQWAYQEQGSFERSVARYSERHYAYVDPEQELAPEYDLVSVRIL